MLRLNQITFSVREIFLYPFPNITDVEIQRFVQPTQIAISKASLGWDAMLRSRTSSLQLAVHL